MESLLATARKVARTDTTVLITGESGTGKEMLAHTLHELSDRRERPMVVVDCSAIAPTLIESELFGHEKGAFTGAHARNPGRLAQAHGATVFLDEIGDLPLDLQSKLLRFVQDKQFTPVGGVSVRTVDARILAATNVDLRARVAQGRFREDLFHRLNVVRLHVPALRERREDVLHLANVFLKQFAALYRRPAHHFTPDAERALEAHPWPGNVRELQNVVLTSALFCERPEVDVADLQLHRDAPASPAREIPPSGVATDGRRCGRARGAAADRRSPARSRRCVASGRPAVPLGKWLAEDLILAADRLVGRHAPEGSELLGLPETTYRRQLQNATRHHAVGPRGTVADLARRRRRAGGSDPLAALRAGRVRVGGGLPAHRDRLRAAGRRPHGRGARRRDRDDRPAPHASGSAVPRESARRKTAAGPSRDARGAPSTADTPASRCDPYR